VEAESLGDCDHDSVIVRSGRLELLHEGVVAETVLNDQVRSCNREAVTCSRLEEMRIGVRVGEHGSHHDPSAADLPGDVAVEVLRSDDAQLSHRRGALATRRKDEGDEAGERE
jgi:hypothetical protein